MDKYDVVIIGAGPAGLKCAEVLGNSDKTTLLLEKNSEIGPKVCAGGITDYNCKYLGLPDEVIGHRFDKITVHSLFSKAVLELDDSPVMTVDRRTLGQWQLNKLKSTSVEIHKNSRVTKVAGDHIVVNGKNTIGFKFLVGADGSNSISRKYLGLNSDSVHFGMQYIVPTKDYDKMEVFFHSRLFKSWYAWIFPHREYVSIGCGCNPKYLPISKLKMNFREWLKVKRIDTSGGEFQVHPLNNDFQGYRFNNHFLVGDAAGLASGLTGEGIYQAMISGEEVANIILNKKHHPEKLNRVIESLQVHDLFKRMLETTGHLRILGYEILVFGIRIFPVRVPFQRF